MPIINLIWQAILKWTGPLVTSEFGKINVKELLQALATGAGAALSTGLSAGFFSKAFILSLLTHELSSVSTSMAQIYTGALTGAISGVIAFLLDLANRYQNGPKPIT